MNPKSKIHNPKSTSVLAVIIGRAGSKGLPGKNAKRLAGHPMICHTIEDALAAETVDRVIVSTDGDAVAAAAESMNVQVVRRPAALASDSATVDSAVRHAVEAVGSNDPIVVILYANVPVRPNDLIDRAVRELFASGADSVQSYSAVGKHHPYWMVTLDSNHRVAPHLPNTVYRRQDLPLLFLPNGGVVSSEGSVIDVDNEADFRFAEAVLSMNGVGASKVQVGSRV